MILIFILYVTLVGMLMALKLLTAIGSTAGSREARLDVLSEGYLVRTECVRTSATSCSMETRDGWRLFPRRSTATGFSL